MVQWPERFDERLHIFAHGKQFDVDAFLAQATLSPDFVWRRDAPITSGVEYLLGDGRRTKLREQEDIAIAYLKAHCGDLRAIASFPGVDAFILGLAYIVPSKANVFGVALHWRRELMLAALDVGVTPVHYLTFDRPTEGEFTP